MTSTPVSSPRAATDWAAHSGPESRHPSVDDLVVDLLDRLEAPGPVAGRAGTRLARDRASSLLDDLRAAPGVPADATRSVERRVITDQLLCAEAAKDQNVYLGKLYTSLLTRAQPDLIFLPLAVAEVQAALRWARRERVPVTIRGAASTALGGAVPNDGGLCLDLARLEQIDVDVQGGVCVVGAGARLRDVHRTLAADELALPVYPSNLGATFAGWLVTGGVGYNAFSPGRALDIVRVAELVLPDGDVMRMHADGRLDVLADGRGHRELPPDLAEAWFLRRGLTPFTLADLARSEGRLGVVVASCSPSAGGRRSERSCWRSTAVTMRSRRSRASAPGPVGRPAAAGQPQARLRTYLDHVRKVWADDDRAWRRLPSELSGQAHMPWRRIVGPARPRRTAGEGGDGSDGGNGSDRARCRRTATAAATARAGRGRGGTAVAAGGSACHVRLRRLPRSHRRARLRGVRVLAARPAGLLHDEACAWPPTASGRRRTSGSGPGCWPPRSTCRRPPCRPIWRRPPLKPAAAGSSSTPRSTTRRTAAR